MIAVVSLVQGLSLQPLLRRDARCVASVAGLRAYCIRAQADDDNAGTAGADSSSPIAWKDAALPSNDDNAGKLLRIRHSTAHVMAMAVQKLFKGTKVCPLPASSHPTTTPQARSYRRCPSRAGEHWAVD
jgi:hypothetical protein